MVTADPTHQETSTKVDLFISGRTLLDAHQMERRERVVVMSEPDRYHVSPAKRLDT